MNGAGCNILLGVFVFIIIAVQFMIYFDGIDSALMTCVSCLHNEMNHVLCNNSEKINASTICYSSTDILHLGRNSSTYNTSVYSVADADGKMIILSVVCITMSAFLCWILFHIKLMKSRIALRMKECENLQLEIQMKKKLITKFSKV